jgi:dolichol-phosphate mannosyltransferase
MIAILILGGSQLLTISIMSEYIWWALDETRRRPKYIIELSSQPINAAPAFPSPDG